MKQQLKGTFMLIAISLSGIAQAALFDRGSGLIYDDVLDITWLQDANAGAGSSFDDGFSSIDGRMTWDNANDWADDLSFGGFSDWRLPEFTGATTCSGFNCMDSEMAHMFYNNMGATAFSSILSGTNSVNLALFSNIQSFIYWSAVEFSPDPSNAWAFGTGVGYQSGDNRNVEFYAWAVRSGDVTASPVPEPGSIWLIGSALIGFIGLRRKR